MPINCFSNKTLMNWDVENTVFWEQTGRCIAIKNIVFSIFVEFLGFSVWQVWSVIVIHLSEIGFHFSANQLFWLAALPGLTGATLRLPYAFMVPFMGGRNWTIISALLLLIPSCLIGIVLQNPNTSYATFIILAMCCGFGGGNFASSMANANYFSPARIKGLVLGINAAGGNIGVSAVQFVAPWVITVPMFGVLGGLSQPTGTGEIWLQNAAFVWVPLILLSVVTSYFFMNNIANIKSMAGEQIKMFKDRHVGLMSILYMGTFGSFIGYSAGFPILIKLEFPSVNALHYAFLGPLVGSLIRPVGGWLSDKIGGAKVTFWNFILMILSACGVVYFLSIKTNPIAFQGFFVMFMCLFVLAGIGNGSTYRMLPAIFLFRNRQKYAVESFEVTRISNVETTAAIGITSAIAAYGAFLIPKIYGTSIALTGKSMFAFVPFIAFYILCVIITWFYYQRHNAEVPC